MSNNTVSGHDAVTLFVGILRRAGSPGRVARAPQRIRCAGPGRSWASSRVRRRSAFAARRIHSLVWVSLLGGILTLLGVILLLVPGIYLAIAATVAVPAPAQREPAWLEGACTLAPADQGPLVADPPGWSSSAACSPVW